MLPNEQSIYLYIPIWVCEVLELLQYLAVIIGAIVIPYLIRSFNVQRDRRSQSFKLAQQFARDIPAHERLAVFDVLQDAKFQQDLVAASTPNDLTEKWNKQTTTVIFMFNQIETICMAIDKKMIDETILKALMESIILKSWTLGQGFVRKHWEMSNIESAWEFFERVARRWS